MGLSDTTAKRFRKTKFCSSLSFAEAVISCKELFVVNTDLITCGNAVRMMSAAFFTEV